MRKNRIFLLKSTKADVKVPELLRITWEQARVFLGNHFEVVVDISVPATHPKFEGGARVRAGRNVQNGMVGWKHEKRA